MTAQSQTEDYSGNAYRACLAGRADARQQQSVASQIILLHGIKGELLAALRAILHTYDDGGVPLTRAFRMANAAIAKATGEAGQ